MRARLHLIAFVCVVAASLTTASRAALAGNETARRDVGSPPPATDTNFGFDFGSYGRVGVGTDLRGHSGYSPQVVSHGARLEKAPYLELSFYYTGAFGKDTDRRWRIVLVPAFAGGDLFHYSGEFTSHFAIRNAYAETANFGARGLSLWVGSRMYRGDDLYLFDYWPLDNLNTVGAGVQYERAKWRFQLQAGLNRLNDLYQYEQLATPPRGFGPAGTATVLDRPRFVASLKLTRQLGDFPGAKISVYSEFHALPAGENVDEKTRVSERLPGDYGWVAGAQLGGWLRPFVFLNLWFRAAGGLSAYGELGVPTSFNRQRRVTNALELVGALSGNWESRWVGVMFGAYVRRFSDPAPGDFNPLSYTEGALAVRPQVYLSNYFHVALEASYQAKKADGLDYVAGRVLLPQVFRFSVMPLVAPLGRGTYSRPSLYLLYTVSVVNDDARVALYDPLDVRFPHGTVHYLGAGVEWWFNSSYR